MQPVHTDSTRPIGVPLESGPRSIGTASEPAGGETGKCASARHASDRRTAALAQQDPQRAPKEVGARHAPVHRNRNIISALVGIVGFFAVWGYGACLGSGGGPVLEMFLDVPTAILVLLTPVTILFAVYGWTGVLGAVTWVFRKPTPGTTAEEAVTFFQLAAAFALAGGFLATMIGLIIMLMKMDDVGTLGPGMAIALLSQLYGVFIAVVCIAVAAHVARRHNAGLTTGPLARRAAGIAGITTIAGTLTAMIAFGIMMLSLAPNL